MTEIDFDELKEEWGLLEGYGVPYKIENKAEKLDLKWTGKDPGRSQKLRSPGTPFRSRHLN